MVLRHSSKVFTSRFSLVYKVLLYTFIVLLLFSAISYASVFSIVEPIVDGIKEMQFFPHISEAFRSIFTGGMDEAFKQVGDDLIAIQQVFANNTRNVVEGGILFLFFIMVASFFINIAKFPASDVYNNFMNSNSRFGFTSNMICNLKKATAYSAVSTLIFFPYYILIGVIAFYVGKLLCSVSILLGLMVVLFIVILMLAIKKAVTSLWLPTYINEDKGVFKSLAYSVSHYSQLILPNFGMYVMLDLVVYVLTVLFGILTFGIGFILALSINQLFYACIELVLYYRSNELKYYVDPATVVNSKTIIKSVY